MQVFFSLPFDVLLQLLEEEGMIIDNPDVFNYIVLGQASTKVIVNQDNMVSRLSKEDLKRIFLGIEKKLGNIRVGRYSN
jgi:ABC-type phosphate transport system substrate-binding protein